MSDTFFDGLTDHRDPIFKIKRVPLEYTKTFFPLPLRFFGTFFSFSCFSSFIGKSLSFTRINRDKLKGLFFSVSLSPPLYFLLLSISPSPSFFPCHLVFRDKKEQKEERAINLHRFRCKAEFDKASSLSFFLSLCYIGYFFFPPTNLTSFHDQQGRVKQLIRHSWHTQRRRKEKAAYWVEGGKRMLLLNNTWDPNGGKKKEGGSSLTNRRKRGQRPPFFPTRFLSSILFPSSSFWKIVPIQGCDRQHLFSCPHLLLKTWPFIHTTTTTKLRKEKNVLANSIQQIEMVVRGNKCIWNKTWGQKERERKRWGRKRGKKRQCTVVKGKISHFIVHPFTVPYFPFLPSFLSFFFSSLLVHVQSLSRKPPNLISFSPAIFHPSLFFLSSEQLQQQHTKGLNLKTCNCCCCFSLSFSVRSMDTQFCFLLLDFLLSFFLFFHRYWLQL